MENDEFIQKRKSKPYLWLLACDASNPILFAIYKMLFVTIEMRHAPFYGWIQDLSAADPTSIFNLFIDTLGSSRIFNHWRLANYYGRNNVYSAKN